MRARFLAIIILGIAFCACSRAPEDTYAQTLRMARAQKDQMLASANDSPVPVGKRSQILPLVYFPPNESYRVPAALRPDAANQVANVLTSTGEQRRMRVVGTLEFTLVGRRLKLEAFAEEGSRGERLFVPFTDLTSGHETYGAGRYLDLDRTSTGIYVIDFNTAYNPYCAYNPTYDCPVPPSQNRLPIAVRAGEKVRGGH